jgi:hypothetical protein
MEPEVHAQSFNMVWLVYSYLQSIKYKNHIVSNEIIIDYVEGVRRLRTTATNGPIVHTPGEMWAWRAKAMMMPAGENSWLVHQSSLAILPAE